MLKLAAGWGNKNAQYTLGLIYYGGHHVAANPALGLAWLQLANERHNDPKIALATRSAVKWATRLQRHRAKQMFRKMRRKYGDKVATVRAWHHWRHWQKSHGRNSGLVCLYGAQLHAARQAGLVGTATAIAQALAQVSGGTHAICVGVTLPVRRHLVRKSADRYFAGWAGVVTVGPLDAVPEPAASSTR